MTDLPVRFPRDPWCRAGTRAMLTLDGETGECFLGLTPDGVQPGRDMLARLTLWRGETPLPYTAAQESGAIVLRAEGGCVRLTLGFPERLIIAGQGVSLLIGKGRAVGMFMSGGSAVDDPQPGVLYVNAGARMRVLPKTGSVEVRSAWNLNALSDPDPRVFLHPDAGGTLDAAVYITDSDEAPAEQDAPTAAEDFDTFLRALTAYPKSEDALHAAYVVWSCRQSARRLAVPQIAGPAYVSNRRTDGTARQSDNVLLAALLRNPAEAARQMCAFLPYAAENGLLPRAMNNRTRLYEAETPYYGCVLRARPDILDALTAEDYAALAAALGWWQRERFCPEKQQFYYLHRYEPGFGAKYPFPEKAPSFAPWLNACLRAWLEAMASLAERFGKPEDAANYRAQAQPLPEALRADEALSRAQALPLLLAGDSAFSDIAAGEIASLRGALTVLAAELTKRGS